MTAFFHHHHNNLHPFPFGSSGEMRNDTSSFKSCHGPAHGAVSEPSSPRSRGSSISNLDGCLMDKKMSRHDSLNQSYLKEAKGKRSRKQKRHIEEKEKKALAEPPLGYIHVRAKRGQATDSHSLAERVRREKISERMKVLQGLVPGCQKVAGKALMLDEIINYVQSLQNQIEFLSMKLACVNPMTFDLSGDYNYLVNKEGVNGLSYSMLLEPQPLPSSFIQASLLQAGSVNHGTLEDYHVMTTPPIPFLGHAPIPLPQMGDKKEEHLNYIQLNNVFSFP
ncbi:hypothetical protein HPP92_011454 [Vanilla planifolia]|uniref:BHLH domain-containing protein n=1 Tax=Vanilla planifolia TaxID=51239 RepID=A0A835V4F6_VANPL|nr:hypothetical protein HPP92_011744 [Vanilla planifolia]KAG0483370.1 hypothetical protein HPP92_011454 [Vanilla planifolia]